LLKNDYILKKETLYNFIKEMKDKKFVNESFKNIETNILTKLVTINEKKETDSSNIIDKNLKYLLTPTKYPNINELKKAIKSYKKKPLPILKAYVFDENDEADKKKENQNKNQNDFRNDINKLVYIEKINNFINSFSEENKNLISRQNIEEDTIEKYLRNSRENESDNSPLDLKFKEFCLAYNEITNVAPYNMTKDLPVKNILNDNIKETPIFQLYKHLNEIQNHFLKKMIEEFTKTKSENKDIIVSNAIEQIKKEIPIQNATKADIFEFNCKNNIILSFDELYFFYSTKNIFNKSKKSKKIDYSNYSKIQFKLSNIEKELINIILTGKKLFSEKQITYQFYLDPYRVEEKTKQFEIFTEIFKKEDLTDDEKGSIISSIKNLKKIILPDLEILINYLIKQNNYHGNKSISEINFHSNLYLNQDFLQLFKNFKFITINKLISLYEFSEENLWENIADRYVNKIFHCTGEIEKLKPMINAFIKNEDDRELKNDMLISLLIKFICRYLPYAKEDMASNDLFKIIKEKNDNLPDNIKKELSKLTSEWGIEVKNAIDLTERIDAMLKSDANKVRHNLNESFISEGGESTYELNDNNHNEDDNEDGNEDDESEERDF
jgi:hypothetical protein